MNRIAALFLLVLVSLPFASFTQVRNADSQLTGIVLLLDKHNQIFYRHKLKAQETVYSLARFFKMPVEDLLLINKINKDQVLAIGTEILVPIEPNEILTPAKRGGKNWVPLLYKVERQETLYKISKNYFPQKIENLITRNNIKSFSIKQGRQLVIGWWSPDSMDDIIEIAKETAEVQPIPTKRDGPASTDQPTEASKKESVDQKKDKKEETIADIIRRKLRNKGKETRETDSPQTEDEVIAVETPSEDVLVEQTTLDTIFPSDLTVIDTVEDTPVPIINYRSGIAIWDKDGFERTNLFVMHNQAKVDSYIRLRYKVTGQEVTAKVISSIPSGLYPSETDIILSPAVAIALGAKDSRFQIQMDFYE